MQLNCSPLTPHDTWVRYLLEATNKWSEFHDLCWDSLSVLHEHESFIVDCWRQILRNRHVNDDFLAEEVPQRIKRRLSIARFELDEQLREKSWATWAKNFAHLLKLKAADLRRSSMKPASPMSTHTNSAEQSPTALVLQATEQPAETETETETQQPEPEPEPELQTETETALPPVDGAFYSLLQQLDVQEYAAKLSEEDIRSEQVPSLSLSPLSGSPALAASLTGCLWSAGPARSQHGGAQGVGLQTRLSQAGDQVGQQPAHIESARRTVPEYQCVSDSNGLGSRESACAKCGLMSDDNV